MKLVAQTFEQEITVNKEDIDDLDHVNNVRYVQWMEDVAKAHWLTNATEDIKKKYFWIVVRHEIDYKRQAFLGDELILRTFVADHTHVTSKRHIHILNKVTGDILIKAKSTWCLMDSETKKPVKISEEMIRVFYDVE